MQKKAKNNKKSKRKISLSAFLKSARNIFSKYKILLLFVFLLLLFLEYSYLIYSTEIISGQVNTLKTVSMKSILILPKYENYRLEFLANEEMKTMSLDEKIGQMFMLSFTGTSINENTNSLIEEYHIGAVVIMSNNISSKSQLKQLTSDLHDFSTLIAVDQEGGAVARIPWDDARLISQKHIGTVDREDFAYEASEDHALALKEYGLDMNLAPVLDVAPLSSFLVSRTLGNDPENVGSLGLEIIKAHQDNDIIATAKHFPGLGECKVDPHSSLPTINISKEDLLVQDILPFNTAIYGGVDVIMTGHALYSEIDNQYPASLSKVFLTDILRGELGFEGVIISDDMRMGALKNYTDKVIDAINAGTDIILIVDSYENQVEYIEQVKNSVEEGSISEERINESVRRILKLKFEYGL